MGELIFFRRARLQKAVDNLTGVLCQLAGEHNCKMIGGRLIPPGDNLVLFKLKGPDKSLSEIQEKLKSKRLAQGHFFPTNPYKISKTSPP